MFAGMIVIVLHADAPRETLRRWTTARGTRAFVSRLVCVEVGCCMLIGCTAMSSVPLRVSAMVVAPLSQP